MNRNLNNVLTMMERKIRESTRLIENEEFANAQRILFQTKRNLTRVRSGISTSTFDSLRNCLDRLQDICEQNSGQESIQRSNGYVAPRVRSGGRGRPEISITENQLKVFIRENFTARQMAHHFNCSTQLIYKKCYLFGIKIRDKYFRGNDDELRGEISNIHNQFPNSGTKMMEAYLRSTGQFVQRHKIRKILADIDPIGTSSRWSNSIQRRTYKVPTPNALWHMDANLKLIRWKFAIHGCIDGYSRLIIYLNCSTSMTARCVLNFFARGANEYGLPSRIRSDFGYENLFVAMVMNVVRGIGRSSHIAGRSVHNQRIERLWVDVVKEVVTFFDNEFGQLEENGLLDVDNNIDMFALQKVYVEFINEKLNAFKDAWNTHSLRTEGHLSPRQLWLSGMLSNCNSQHTAPREIFQDQPDLYTRILDSFQIEDANIPLINQNQEAESNLAVQLELNNEQNGYVSRILEDISLDYKTRFLEIREYLHNSY